MTSNEKRLMMLKKIINSDNGGIDILYEKFTTGNCKCNITPKEIVEAMGESAADYLDNPFDVILFGAITAKAVEKLFNEEEK